MRSFFGPQLNLVILVMTLHKMHSTAALKPDSSRHDSLRYVQCVMLMCCGFNHCVELYSQ